jgi:hypothetical protein
MRKNQFHQAKSSLGLILQQSANRTVPAIPAFQEHLAVMESTT